MRGNINNRFRKPKLNIKEECVDAADDRGNIGINISDNVR